MLIAFKNILYSKAQGYKSPLKEDFCPVFHKIMINLLRSSISFTENIDTIFMKTIINNFIKII